jgi:hypothetical protein
MPPPTLQGLNARDLQKEIYQLKDSKQRVHEACRMCNMMRMNTTHCNMLLVQQESFPTVNVCSRKTTHYDMLLVKQESFPTIGRRTPQSCQWCPTCQTPAVD